MSIKAVLLCLAAVPACAQKPGIGEIEAQAAELRSLVAHAPRLAVERIAFKIQPPDSAWEIGYPSSVAMDKNGEIYVLQRGEKADPVLVLNREGRVLRSWGKGMFKIPHSIRIDPAGNIWTVDAASSLLFKFTPKGEKLMEISVGGQPVPKSGTNGAGPNGAGTSGIVFNGTTDIAFAPNGHLFISDGYGNARVLEYTPEGKRVREWGSAGTGPGQFHQPHGIAIDPDGIIYIADRQNGRLQRFDLQGRFLGEWANLGMATSVATGGGALWIGTQQRNEPTSAAGWIMKIDPNTGAILGYVESAHAQHVVNVAANGDLLSGARPDAVVWFHATKR